jgi:3',5'-cyclic AMP phosphodiesterase CpdA
VTAIPGNHDAYVRLHPERGTGHWQPYMEANAAGEALVPTPAAGFPFVRRFGEIVIIALSSAVPTLPFVAAGKLGSAQRAFLATALEVLRRHDLFRVVLVHHSPLPGQANWQRGLRDAKALAEILKEKGAELVLHGHNHEQTVRALETVSGTAIVVGVPSASEAVAGRIPAARYNEYGIARTGPGWRVEMTGRAVASPPERVEECERRVLRES